MEPEPPSGDGPGPGEPGPLTSLLQAIAALPAKPGSLADAPDLQPGDRVGRFEILRTLGRGGFGVVYEARDETLRRSVALKTVRRRGSTTLPTKRLLLEADAAARLSHPNIVTLHDVGTSDHGPYLVMELLRGESLSARTARGPLPPADAVRIALEVARGLAHAHALGVVHRDLKPANVFLCAEGTVKVLDFGLAHALGQPRPEGGTPAYMAPEQRAGAPEDERTDVFALGVILYQMLAGERPFGVEGDNPFRRRARPLEIDQSPALSELVARMLERDPVRRPRDGAEVAEALTAIQRELDTTPSTPSRPVRARRRWRLALGLLAASVLTAAAVRLFWPASPAPAFPHGRVALADVANETGEPELEISGLLRTVLEQSTVIDVLPRTRLVDSLREAHGEEVGRIDETLGAEAARRCGARALLLSRLLRFGSRYVMEVRIVDPVSGGRLFSFKEQEDARERLPELLDRVGEQVRLLLGEDPRSIRERTIPARAVTSNLAAWRHYTAGMACLEQRSFATSFGACLAEMQQAVELDPGFALAHLQISQLHFLSGDARALQKASLERAQRHPARVPPHERLKLRGWAAFVDGDDVQAKALFREAAEAAPDDKHAWYLAGEIPYHRDEFAESLPFFRRVNALDPLWLDASQHLSLALGATGDTVGLRAQAAALSALGAKPEAITGLCYAQLWFEPGSAVATCERARAAGAGQGGDEMLAIALLHAGARATLDEHLAAMARKPGPPGFAWCMSLWLLGQEGRWPELRRRSAEWTDRDSSWFHVTLAEMVLGAGDRELAWREALRVLELDRVLLSSLAVHFAYQGDLARAAELREYLPVASPRVEVHDAVVRWRKGDPAGAVEPLRRVAAAAPLSTDPAIPPPLYLLGEVLAEAGRDAEAVDALRRFQALPLSYPSWFVPRSQYFLARSLDRLGDRDAARGALRPLLRLWKEASPEQPLLAEARALGARLGVR